MTLIKDDGVNFLVMSLEKTWQGQHWMGWFSKEWEATYERIAEA